MWKNAPKNGAGYGDDMPGGRKINDIQKDLRTFSSMRVETTINGLQPSKSEIRYGGREG